DSEDELSAAFFAGAVVAGGAGGVLYCANECSGAMAAISAATVGKIIAAGRFAAREDEKERGMNDLWLGKGDAPTGKIPWSARWSQCIVADIAIAVVDAYSRYNSSCVAIDSPKHETLLAQGLFVFEVSAS